jgi:hypothetical protein
MKKYFAEQAIFKTGSMLKFAVGLVSDVISVSLGFK